MSVTQPAYRIALAWALLLALASIPVLTSVMPPLFDYPNHLARMHLLTVGGDRFYQVRWAPLPNLAEDAIVPVLAAIMPLELAGKLFLIAIFALLSGGTLWLNREATGRWHYWPLTGFLFLYSRVFLWGFVNYLFGLGLALCGVALWLRLEARPVWLRVATIVPIGVFCYLSHIEAFAIFSIVLAGIEAPLALAEWRARHWSALARRVALLLTPAILPVLLFLIAWHPAESGGIQFARIWRKADMLFSVFDNYSRPFDIVGFAGIVILLLWLGFTRRLGLGTRLGIAAGLLAIIYVTLPSQLFSGSGADHRLPLALFLLLIAGSAPRIPSWIGGALFLLLLLRLSAIERVWLESNPIYRADIAAIDQLPRGVKLAVAFPAGAINSTPIPEIHLPTLAAGDPDGLVPTLFTYEGQQPIALTPLGAGLTKDLSPDALWQGFVLGNKADRIRLLPALQAMDYLAVTGAADTHVPDDRCLVPVFRRPSFQLFRIEADACS